MGEEVKVRRDSRYRNILLLSQIMRCEKGARVGVNKSELSVLFVFFLVKPEKLR